MNNLDLNDIPEYSSICLVGRRRSGKGVLCKDLVRKCISQRKLRNAYLFSPTANIANNPMDYIPEENRFLELDIDKLDEILKKQEEILRNDPKGNHSILLIIDDIVGSLNSKQKNMINKIFILGRHLQIYLIFCVQSVKNEFTPTMRGNCDVVAIFNQANYFNKEQLSYEYLSLDMDKKTGIALIDRYAVGHQSLIILNTNKSGKIQDYIFTYTAEHPIRNFKLRF